MSAAGVQDRRDDGCGRRFSVRKFDDVIVGLVGDDIGWRRLLQRGRYRRKINAHRAGDGQNDVRNELPGPTGYVHRIWLLWLED